MMLEQLTRSGRKVTSPPAMTPIVATQCGECGRWMSTRLS